MLCAVRSIRIGNIATYHSVEELLDINPHVILHAAAICRTESINIDRARAEAVNVMVLSIF